MCVSKIMSIDVNIAGNMTMDKDCLYTLYIKSCIHNIMYEKKNFAAKKDKSRKNNTFTNK